MNGQTKANASEHGDSKWKTRDLEKNNRQAGRQAGRLALISAVVVEISRNSGGGNIPPPSAVRANATGLLLSTSSRQLSVLCSNIIACAVPQNPICYSIFNKIFI